MPAKAMSKALKADLSHDIGRPSVTSHYSNYRLRRRPCGLLYGPYNAHGISLSQASWRPAYQLLIIIRPHKV